MTGATRLDACGSAYEQHNAMHQTSMKTLQEATISSPNLDSEYGLSYAKSIWDSVLG